MRPMKPFLSRPDLPGRDLKSRYKGPTKCRLCEFIGDRDEIMQHMVDAHKFIKVGAQVFQRFPCVMCPKPGLFKLGGVAYCKEHRHYAVDIQKKIAAEIDDKARRRERVKKTVDDMLIGRETLRLSKRRR